MKIPKEILSNNERVPHFEKISTQILLKNQKDRVIIIPNFRVLALRDHTLRDHNACILIRSVDQLKKKPYALTVTYEHILQWFGQMTLWCKRELREMAFKVLGGDLAKRLLGVGVIWPKDSLVPCRFSPGTKESFG